MIRKTMIKEPFNCHPDHGCRNPECPGQPPGSPKSHGRGTDEHHFAVVCSDHGRALSLFVFGERFHASLENDPAVEKITGILPRSGTLNQCEKVGELDPDEVVAEVKHGQGCPYLLAMCKNEGVSGLGASAFWFNVGDNEAIRSGGEQPEEFWLALEAVARAWCPECEPDSKDEQLAEEVLSGPVLGSVTCARTACSNRMIARSSFKHRDLEGLYCASCAKKINAASGLDLVTPLKGRAD